MKKILIAATIFNIATSLFAQSNKSGWVDLFDGKSLNGWKKVAGDAEYKIEDGAIAGVTVANTPNTFLITEQEYGDFALELEVKIMDTTSNSGIQFRSHFDPAGNDGKGKVFGYQYELDPSSRRWTGGIYDEGRRDWLYPLSYNASAQAMLKTGVYNRIKLECIGNTIRTWINGKPAAFVVDDMDNKGVIALQVHSIGKADMAGKKIYWKNIRIRNGVTSPSSFPGNIYVFNTIPNTLSDFEKQSGWKLLFDGKTSNGWVGAYKRQFPAKGWEIKDGMLKVLSSGGAEAHNGGDIVTKEKLLALGEKYEAQIAADRQAEKRYR